MMTSYSMTKRGQWCLW